MKNIHTQTPSPIAIQLQHNHMDQAWFWKWKNLSITLYVLFMLFTTHKFFPLKRWHVSMVRDWG